MLHFGRGSGEKCDNIGDEPFQIMDKGDILDAYREETHIFILDVLATYLCTYVVLKR